MFRLISICVFFASISLLGAQQSDVQMPDDLNEAYSSLSMHDRNTIKTPYQIADIEIRSYPGTEVIVGIDQDNDGKWDEFIGLQTNENYDVKGSFRAELIYFRNLFIIRPIDKEQESYVLRFSDNEELQELMAKIPSYYLEGQHLFGYGLRHHRGDYTFEYFVNE